VKSSKAPLPPIFEDSSDWAMEVLFTVEQVYKLLHNTWTDRQTNRTFFNSVALLEHPQNSIPVTFLNLLTV
jgi:hypothetical protein